MLQCRRYSSTMAPLFVHSANAIRGLVSLLLMHGADAIRGPVPPRLVHGAADTHSYVPALKISPSCTAQ